MRFKSGDHIVNIQSKNKYTIRHIVENDFGFYYVMWEENGNSKYYSSIGADIDCELDQDYILDKKLECLNDC